jgi:CelD/BcsL family acetyltransferase involved in cellulose biosynthesis
MADTAVFDRSDARALPRAATPEIAARSTRSLAEIAGIWAELEAAGGVQSPGQNLAFVRTWIETQQVAEADQLYLVAERSGTPLALLALRRERRLGVNAYTWVLGNHVGCNGPIADPRRLEALGTEGRRTLWAEFARAARNAGADLLHLPAMASDVPGHGDLYAEFGRSVAGDTLYRAEFDSWESADSTQRNKSRRKHDRQQGDKLSALGEIRFEDVGPEYCTTAILERMFIQRAERFAQMGIADPFAAPRIRRFYAEALRPGADTGARLSVLRLNGEIVAVRYNIVRGTRMFCLISSMSTEPALQPGSPGKQILLRLMQTIFDAGFHSFDMGAGLTDEKRHWCNVQIALRDHVVPLTLKGRLAADLVATTASLKSRIKSDPRLLGLAKRIRALLNRGHGTPASGTASAED